MPPADGPATTFVADPIVKDLVTLSTDYHGLVVTTMWPPPTELMDAYAKLFLPEVRKCFDEVDLVGQDAPCLLYTSPSPRD